jgi:peptidoglycan/xylan/chitin deacetylase (PgdA/CDA1 family)
MTAHGAHFVSIDQIYAHLVSGRPLPSHAVAITAADGYLGFYKLAVPVFERYHVPVTEFVHTKFVGGRQGRWKMNWSQLKQLDREGLVSIQSQTVTHEDLPTLSVDKVDWEMRESKHVLEARLGHPIRFIAYPDGKFDARSERAAQQAGYAMAFSEVTRPCEESPSFFAVNRYVHTKWRQAWRDSFGD